MHPRGLRQYPPPPPLHLTCATKSASTSLRSMRLIEQKAVSEVVRSYRQFRGHGEGGAGVQAEGQYIGTGKVVRSCIGRGEKGHRHRYTKLKSCTWGMRKQAHVDAAWHSVTHPQTATSCSCMRAALRALVLSACHAMNCTCPGALQGLNALPSTQPPTCRQSAAAWCRPLPCTASLPFEDPDPPPPPPSPKP
jgi:hypothetical protein